jgi:hypothetical protein
MTAREIDAATLAQLVANGGWPVFLLDIELDGAPQRIGSGFRGTVLDPSTGLVYRGLGQMGSFTIGSEQIGGLASGAKYSLSGIDPSNNTEIPGFRAALGADLSVPVQFRAVRLRVATLNAAAQVVGTPALLRADLGDALVLTDNGATLEIQLSAEMRSVDFKRIRRSTNSAPDHKRLHPNVIPDTIFDDDRWRRTDIRWGQRKTDGDPTA